MYPVYLITCTHPKYAPHMMPYVGCCPSGQDVEKRFKEHLGGFGGAKYLTKAIKKYGKEWFHVEQIDAGNTPEQCLELEQWWIKILKTRVADHGGYNITEGGDNPPHSHKPLSEETKEKIRKKHLESGHMPSHACTEKSRINRLGKKLSPERVAKSAKAHCGIKHKSHKPFSLESRKHMSRIPWNKGTTGAQVAWNKGKTDWMSEEGKRNIVASARKRNMSAFGAHSLWHVKRGIFNPNCEFCNTTRRLSPIE